MKNAEHKGKCFDANGVNQILIILVKNSYFCDKRYDNEKTQWQQWRKECTIDVVPRFCAQSVYIRDNTRLK